RDLHCGAGVQGVKPKLPHGVEQQFPGIGRPVIGANGVTLRRFLLAFVLDGAGGRSQRCQLLARHQHGRLARRGYIHVIQSSVLPAVVGLYEGTLELSGLHFTSSGPRPSMPPGLNISSIVSSFFVCGSCEAGDGTDCATQKEVASTQQTNAANRDFTLTPTKKICSGEVYIR